MKKAHADAMRWLRDHPGARVGDGITRRLADDLEAAGLVHVAEDGSVHVVRDPFARVEALAAVADRLEASATELVAAARDLRAHATKIGAVAHELLAATGSAMVEAHPPLCPKCGGAMGLRANKASGNKFWGCLLYRARPKLGQPSCDGTVDFGRWRTEAREALATVLRDPGAE